MVVSFTRIGNNLLIIGILFAVGYIVWAKWKGKSVDFSRVLGIGKGEGFDKSTGMKSYRNIEGGGDLFGKR